MTYSAEEPGHHGPDVPHTQLLPATGRMLLHRQPPRRRTADSRRSQPA
jgi:hypothetical protein